MDTHCVPWDATRYDSTGQDGRRRRLFDVMDRPAQEHGMSQQLSSA